ncbi:MAG: hypothetical protein IPL19_19545 [Sandaracinaceae bacterium]|nr:hypothetical protein [Sandaracinaceae bacterium]
MESPSPGELFERTFNPATTEILVRSLRRAYGTACEHHEPERGGNEATFGYGLYHYAVHELCLEAERASDEVTEHVTQRQVIKNVTSRRVTNDVTSCKVTMAVSSKRPLFRLQIGPYEVACHRVGLSERESIWTAFPKNEGAALSMMEEQFRMPLFGFGGGVESARKLILAHLGNADEGMRAVYLCIPGKTEGGRITGWLFARPIFRADEKTAAAPSTKQVLLPEVVVEEPTVTLKSKRTDEAALPPEVAATELVVTRKPKKSAHEATG